VIGACQPVIMLLIAGRVFGEHPRRLDWALAGVALGGVGLVLFGSSGLPAWSPLGDALSVLTVIAWTLYFVFSKLTRTRIDAAQYTGGTAIVAAMVATPFALVSGQVFEWPTLNAWFWLILLSVGPGLTSHMLMNWALGYVPAWFGSTLTLAIPVTSTLLAWAFLNEAVVLLQFLGMAVVVGALGVLVTQQSRQRA
ncbi:MAG: DMT family transporter, partial [Actinomycetota bacterium]